MSESLKSYEAIGPVSYNTCITSLPLMCALIAQSGYEDYYTEVSDLLALDESERIVL